MLKFEIYRWSLYGNISGYVFHHAPRYWAKTCHGVGPESWEHNFKATPSKVIQRSRYLTNALWLPNLVGRTPDQSVMHCWGRRSCGVSWGQPEVKLLRNALWLPNLVGRTPDQSVMHWWVKGHVGVSWGQPEVKLLRNALWLPNLVGRTPDQSVMHCWCQRSCSGQLGSTRDQIA